MKIVLTPQQKQQLEQMHDTERDSRVCDRIKAVLLASEGWSQVMISQALCIHESTVARHLSDYVLSEKLKPENGASQCELSETQTMQLIEWPPRKGKCTEYLQDNLLDLMLKFLLCG